MLPTCDRKDRNCSAYLYYCNNLVETRYKIVRVKIDNSSFQACVYKNKINHCLQANRLRETSEL